jgi:hypothetical protein
MFIKHIQRSLSSAEVSCPYSSEKGQKKKGAAPAILRDAALLFEEIDASRDDLQQRCYGRYVILSSEG